MATRTFEATPESVPAARGFVVNALGGMSPDLLATVALLVSELATNAVLYGDGSYQVTATYSRRAQRVHVGVTDSGAGMPRQQHPAASAEHGRGLQLVDALSQRWGLESSSRKATKTVWFELAVDEDATRERRRA